MKKKTFVEYGFLILILCFSLNSIQAQTVQVCTKYNWRKKISSHPDWYSNVIAR